jgi:hypothetical protein
MEYSITRSLAELKLLDKRIHNAIQVSEFGGMAVGKKPVQGYADNATFETKVQSNWDSVNDLIKRRNAIKSAIVLSNAKTLVNIAGVEMTVAEAIERKSSIVYDKALLNKLRNDYNIINNAVLRKNMEVEQKLEQQLAVLYGKDAKVSESERDMVTKPYREDHEAKIIDPIQLKDKIESLTEYIDSFESECDFILSESNTVTKIEVE